LAEATQQLIVGLSRYVGKFAFLLVYGVLRHGVACFSKSDKAAVNQFFIL